MAGLLSAAQIAGVATLANKLLDTPVTIWRAPTASSGPWAITPDTPVQVGACNVLFTRPSAPTLAAIAQAYIGVEMSWQVFFPASADVRGGDELHIIATGERVKVQVVEAPQSYSPLKSALTDERR